MTGESFAQPVPIPADRPLLALWVHVDLDGHASFGGKMTRPDTISALRFLADQLEAGMTGPGAPGNEAP